MPITQNAWQTCGAAVSGTAFCGWAREAVVWPPARYCGHVPQVEQVKDIMCRFGTGRPVDRVILRVTVRSGVWHNSWFLVGCERAGCSQPNKSWRVSCVS